MVNNSIDNASSDPITNPQQQKWNRRYQQATTANAPALVLSDNSHLLPSQGQALDLACGLGGNALLLAGLGLETQAWDLSDVVIHKLQTLADQQQLPLQARCVDLDQQPLPAAMFDVISVSGFLDRKLCPAITAALKSARDLDRDVLVEVEVESHDELLEALDAGAARILLDNFSLDALRQAVKTNESYGYTAAELEASGNITLDTIRTVAETGVDYISTGAITKNIEAIDFSMLFKID